jgi:hypothetical protein
MTSGGHPIRHHILRTPKLKIWLICDIYPLLLHFSVEFRDSKWLRSISRIQNCPMIRLYLDGSLWANVIGMSLKSAKSIVKVRIVVELSLIFGFLLPSDHPMIVSSQIIFLSIDITAFKLVTLTGYDLMMRNSESFQSQNWHRKQIFVDFHRSMLRLSFATPHINSNL